MRTQKDGKIAPGQRRQDSPNESLGQEGKGLIQELDEGQCGWSTEWVEWSYDEARE